MRRDTGVGRRFAQTGIGSTGESQCSNMRGPIVASPPEGRQVRFSTLRESHDKFSDYAPNTSATSISR